MGSTKMPATVLMVARRSLEDDQVEEIIEKAKLWAILNGRLFVW